MTTYRRRGHYRRSKNGGYHWVSSHTVTRTRSGLASPTFPNARVYRPTPVRYLSRYSERWVRPNAACPVCRAPVYFYSNEYGSRVFFDEIGPPWPKHPCTDHGSSHPANPRIGAQTVSPGLYRYQDGREMIRQARSNMVMTPPPRTDQTGWIPYVVLRRDDAGARATLHLHELYSNARQTLWAVPASVAVGVGALMFVRGDTASYLDTASSQPMVTRIEFLGVGPHRKSLVGRLWARLAGAPPV